MTEDYRNRIADWLDKRQQLLVSVFELHQIAPAQLITKPSQQKVNSFCQHLIDYVSAGHFEIYHRLMDRLDDHAPLALDRINGLLNKIQDTTDVAVQFNDIYDSSNNTPLDGLFRRRLSDLAESLAERFEMEDILLDQCQSQSKSLSA